MAVHEGNGNASKTPLLERRSTLVAFCTLSSVGLAAYVHYDEYVHSAWTAVVIVLAIRAVFGAISGYALAEIFRRVRESRRK